MNQLNSIIIEGNLAQEPELTKTPSGMEVCNLPIAVNRFHKNSNGEEINEVSFFDIEAWGDLAKISAKKGQRGVRIRAVGRIKQNRWTGSDGKNYSRICIIADHIEYIKKPKEEASIEEIPEHSALKEEVESKEELIVF